MSFYDIVLITCVVDAVLFGLAALRPSSSS